jgi:hypothetical protein
MPDNLGRKMIAAGALAIARSHVPDLRTLHLLPEEIRDSRVCLLASLRALAASGPSEGMLDSAPTRRGIQLSRDEFRAIWQAQLATLIAEIEPSDEG